jgi:hypothetical protein
VRGQPVLESPHDSIVITPSSAFAASHSSPRDTSTSSSSGFFMYATRPPASNGAPGAPGVPGALPNAGSRAAGDEATQQMQQMLQAQQHQLQQMQQMQQQMRMSGGPSAARSR